MNTKKNVSFANLLVLSSKFETMSKLSAVHGNRVAEVLQINKAALNEISQELWSHPETCYKEVFAHQILTDFLEKHGFTVERGYKNVATAFRAEFVSANYDRNLHATIAVLCEYDALPEIGHACGHNLIAGN